MQSKDYCEICFKKRKQKDARFLEIGDISKMQKMGFAPLITALSICDGCTKMIIQFIYDNSHKTMQKFQGKPK